MEILNNPNKGVDMKFYTGVGARKTPKEVLEIMTAVAQKLDGLGFTLRSGGADGADKAFEAGATRKEIFVANDATPAAKEIAARFHPAWFRCSEYAQKLHGRNAFQVLGRGLNWPSSFLLCWTPDGCISHDQRTIETGGTGTAISIADYYNVRVFNLAREEHIERMKVFLNK